MRSRRVSFLREEWGHRGAAMPDEMFFSNDERGLVRGRRAAKRTETFRPCLITLPDGGRIEGIILNLTPHGMLVRLMGTLPVGTRVEVQMMRDESFQKPLAEPRYGAVARLAGSDGMFSDLGIKIDNKRPPSARPKVKEIRPRVEAPARAKPQGMQTVEITKGNSGPVRRK